MAGLQFFTFTPCPATHPPVQLPLLTTARFACPYLPGKVARNQVLISVPTNGDAYQGLMDAGFRRSGTSIYRPACPQCNACRPLRVEVERFTPDKSQRRCWRRNADLVVSVDKPRPSAEKFALYQRYIARCHDGDGGGYETFIDFLYKSRLQTREFTYRDAGGRLLAVGLCDISAHALSSVYLYRDPDEARRGLGNFSALWEIDYCRRHGIAYYYLGYWVQDSRKMRYKTDFRPYQLLDVDGTWVTCEAPQAR